MVYIRIKPKTVAMVGERLTLGDVADLLADARLNLQDMQVSLPQGMGIWQIDALQLIVQMQEHSPNEVINLLGDGMGWLYRETRGIRNLREKGGHRHGLLWGLLYLMVTLGIVLIAGLFHLNGFFRILQSDMPKLIDQGLMHAFFLALPCILWICLGIALYYRFFAQRTATSLTMKLREYRDDMGRNPLRKNREL